MFKLLLSQLLMFFYSYGADVMEGGTQIRGEEIDRLSLPI